MEFGAVRLAEIVNALEALGGEASAKAIKDKVTEIRGGRPAHYKRSHSYRETIQKIIEDHCPDSANWTGKRPALFKRVSRGVYQLTASSDGRMSRRAFIESHGATCANWTWSWSFVNAARRQVIFGAWTHHAIGDTCLILDDDWEVRRGRKQPGYAQAREHIRLVQDEGFELFTFPIIKADLPEGSDGGPASIGGFTPTLTQMRLVRAGTRWYGARSQSSIQLSEEMPGEPHEFVEGAARSVTVNAYERSGPARLACLKHHGYTCAACGFDFERAYGPLGAGYIHVHHVVSISNIRQEYVIDPVKDLIPVCPNCHALIHRTQPPLTVTHLKVHLASQDPFEWPRASN